MANSLAGFLSVYAQESLPQLIAQAPLFSSFTTDLSDSVAQDGASVITRIPTSTYALNDTAANGYTELQATASSVTVTLKHRDITHGFTELEWTNDPTRVYNTFVPSMVQSFIDLVSVDTMNLITNANFGASHVAPVSAFSGSAATRLAQILSTAKVPLAGRSLIVLPTYYESLINSVSPAYSYGNSEPVQNYRFTKYAGFGVTEFADLPANGESLVGFAAQKSAIAIATRIPSVPSNFPGEVATLSDDASGLAIQFRNWFSPNDGKYKLAATLIFGSAKGNANALKRITSA